MDLEHLGRHHARIKEIRRAFRDGTLTEDGLMAIEGPRMIKEALRSGLEIIECIQREGEHLELPPGVSQHIVDASVMDGLALTQSSQGVVALVRLPRFSLEEMLRCENPLVVVLCGLQDPGNLGTIIRLGEAFGATGCVTTPRTVGPYNGKMVRATAGSLFRLPNVWNADFAGVCRALEGHGVRLVGAGSDGSVPIDRYDFRAPTAILLGNEPRGLDQAERAACDTILRIPQAGQVDSLNVATAAAVILYEAARQRWS